MKSRIYLHVLRLTFFPGTLKHTSALPEFGDMVAKCLFHGVKLQTGTLEARIPQMREQVFFFLLYQVAVLIMQSNMALL